MLNSFAFLLYSDSNIFYTHWVIFLFSVEVLTAWLILF